MWPEELARWAADIVADDCAIGAIWRRAGHDRERAIEALQRALLSASRWYERTVAQKRTYEYYRAFMCWKADKLLIDEFRVSSRTSQLGDEQSLPATKDDVVRERAAVLREVLVEMPADVQELLRLRAEGYTLEEIAETVGSSAGTIHRRLQKPLAKLRERLLEVDADLFAAYLKSEEPDSCTGDEKGYTQR